MWVRVPRHGEGQRRGVAADHCDLSETCVMLCTLEGPTAVLPPLLSIASGSVRPAAGSLWSWKGLALSTGEFSLVLLHFYQLSAECFVWRISANGILLTKNNTRGKKKMHCIKTRLNLSLFFCLFCSYAFNYTALLWIVFIFLIMWFFFKLASTGVILDSFSMMWYVVNPLTLINFIHFAGRWSLMSLSH